MNHDTTDLYRYYDSDGRLLYVGISFSAIARAAQHRSDKGWWRDVDRMTVERMPTRCDAEVAERHAIINEKPLHNVVWNGGGLSRHNRAPSGPAAAVEFDCSDIISSQAPADRHGVVDALNNLNAAIDAVARMLDSPTGSGYAPPRDVFVETVNSMCRSVVYGDCCDECDEVRSPLKVEMTSKTGLKGTYYCCQQAWTCHWTRDLSALWC